MSTLRFQIPDALDRVAPPEQVLAVSVIGDTAFVAIEKMEETGEVTTTTQVAEITVDLLALGHALSVLAADARRDAFRQKDKTSYITTNGVSTAPMVRAAVVS